MSQIGFIVVSAGGAYSDAWHNNICIYLTRDGAEKEIVRLEEEAALNNAVSIWLNERSNKFEDNFRRLSPEPKRTCGTGGRYHLDDTYRAWHNSKLAKMQEAQRQAGLDAVAEFQIKEDSNLFESLKNYTGYLSNFNAESGCYQIEEVDIKS